MTVYLVGAGPGGIEAVTVGALRLLQRADVVVHDRLVDQAVLDCIPACAERIDVGKNKGVSDSQALINELLVALGRRYSCVVRLKGGDPFVFGRGGEELIALRSAGIAVEVMPGVASAFAAPAAAFIPVTHRGVARGVIVITGHTDFDPRIDFAALSQAGVTLVVLMGVAKRSEIACYLIGQGMDAETPVAIIERALTPAQRTVHANLVDLGAVEVTSPAVMVIGEVAALGREQLREFVGAEHG